MRYFLLILLCLRSARWSALPGFAGSLSRRPPIEVFPDMNRQPKLRPQTPIDVFHERRQFAIAARRNRAACAVQPSNGPGDHFEDIPVNTGRITGTTNFVANNPLPVTAELLAARAAAFQHLLLALPRRARRRQRHHQENRRHARRGQSA